MKNTVRLKLALAIPPVPDVSFPQQRSGAPPSVSSDSLPSPPVSEELVNEGLEMLMDEFSAMKSKTRAPANLLPVSPALFPSQSPLPPPLNLSCQPISPFFPMHAPYSAGYLPASSSHQHFGFFSGVSPVPPMPPQSAMIPQRKNEQVFFGRDFDGLMLRTHGGTQRMMASPVPMAEQYPQFDPMQRVQKFKTYSKKVFIGGIPAGTKSDILLENFSHFGKAIVDWPKKLPSQEAPPSGYAFVVFDEESSVCNLLNACVKDGKRMFYNLVMAGGRMNPVEIKVWAMADSIYVGELGWRKHRRYSVFLGGLPRTCSAAYLAHNLQQVIGTVVYCIIELDRVNEYPKGAGCIVFKDRESYLMAIASHQLNLRFEDGVRKVEMKPFIANDMQCDKCKSRDTKYCSNLICLSYYCDQCWAKEHNNSAKIDHIPMKRGRGDRE